MASEIAPVSVPKITQALRLLVPDGGVFEVRVLNTSRGTVSGYFDDAEAAAIVLKGYDGKHSIYATLNQVNPALLARASNRLVDYSKITTSDTDIVRRRWLPIDFDPCRPGGISSSDDEKEEALERAREARAFLRDMLGWPPPIFADSGNGAHLLYSVDLPNDKDATELIKRCLRAISMRFTDEKVKIDEVVYNAARIWKVYGTLSCKGENMPDRPHRRAAVLESPAVVSSVSLEHLQRLAASVPDNVTHKPRGMQSKSRALDSSELELQLDTWGININHSKPWEGGTVFVLEECPFNTSHTNGSAAVIQLADGHVVFKCFHDSCIGKTWPELRSLVGDNEYQEAPQDEEHGHEDGGTVPEKLVALAADVEYFRSERGEAFGRIRLSDHAEIRPLNSDAFKVWLGLAYYTEYGKPAGKSAIDDAIRVLEGFARYRGEEYPLGVRCARSAADGLGETGPIYLDMADRLWRTIEVACDGWSIVDQTPPLFRRHASQAAFVEPSRSARPTDLACLRTLINVARESDWYLFVVWLVAAWIPEIAHPILVVYGEQGSAKSTMMRIAGRAVDPSRTPLQSEPTDVGQWVQNADHGWLITLDNVSTLPAWLSDALCRAVTGDAFLKRKLYSDDEDILREFRRVVALTGIEVVVQRADLLERSLLLGLEPIAPENRRSETEVLAEFEAMRPTVVGALLSLLSAVLRELPSVKLTASPRMADFARIGVAVERVLGWERDAFMAAYMTSVDDQNAEALSSYPVTEPLLSIIGDEWHGSAQELLSQLLASVDEKVTRAAGWPKTARSVSGQLRRMAPNLRAIGIDITHERSGHRRTIRIRRRKSQSTVICVTTVTSGSNTAESSDANTAPSDANSGPMTQTLDDFGDFHGGDDANDANDAKSPSSEYAIFDEEIALESIRR